MAFAALRGGHQNNIRYVAGHSTVRSSSRLAEQLVQLLWDGKAQPLREQLTALSTRAGPPLETDPPNHPRKVLASNVGYFAKHQEHIDYPSYRAKGWPIGSGITESGVKLFGKRVKGTEQFWNVPGAEAILALRSKWFSEDEASTSYWLGWSSKVRAA